MTFLNSFLRLCELKDVPPTRALEEAGLSRSLYSKWKAAPTFVPNGSTLEKLSRYFLVSIDTLKGNSPFGPSSSGLEGMPEMEELFEAAHRMPLTTRQNILAYAKFICSEAFDEKK